jgi:hypothetical protein
MNQLVSCQFDFVNMPLLPLAPKARTGTGRGKLSRVGHPLQGIEG